MFEEVIDPIVTLIDGAAGEDDEPVLPQPRARLTARTDTNARSEVRKFSTSCLVSA
jgi:hypothetical protein